MNKLNQLGKIIVVFLAGFILLINTACNRLDSSRVARESGRAGADTQKVVKQSSNPDYDYYDANQPKQGGMNKYNDDPRLDDPKLQKKADRLIDGAKANLQQRNRDREKYVDEVSKTGKVLGDIKDDAVKNTSQFKKEISQGAQEEIDGAKDNFKKAGKIAEESAKTTADSLEDMLKNRNNMIQRNTENT